MKKPTPKTPLPSPGTLQLVSKEEKRLTAAGLDRFPALIVRAGASRFPLRRILHRQHPQWEHAPRLRPSRRAILHMVRRKRAGDASAQSHRGCRLHRATPSRAPNTLRLVGTRSNPANESCQLGSPPKYVVKRGKTPVLSTEEIRQLSLPSPLDEYLHEYIGKADLFRSAINKTAP